ncbi:nitroreductase family protein [Amycolatopsis endophytica]|uniref:Nitroreductase n=1 Tax=Amycolatopsis endophytica TaxID=860233 RepID=A0A853B283_9PSEU|nr:nitroreductase family protein [Amycolatopsis endophytica]NYI88927.1 nitroreductase [Amycolatopsis endophytica]
MRKPADSSAPLSEPIAQRWSPRALDETREVSWEQLRALLEAARWAASFGNTQPARFLAGRRGDATFRQILGTLTERNQAWAHRAGALLVAIAVTRNEKGEIPYAEYGLGLAAQNLVLQAVEDGLVAHQMAGFDADAVREAFAVPADAVPRVAIAVGHAGDPALLGVEKLVSREQAPRQRLPLGEIAYTGEWGMPAF